MKLKRPFTPPEPVLERHILVDPFLPGPESPQQPSTPGPAPEAPGFSTEECRSAAEALGRLTEEFRSATEALGRLTAHEELAEAFRRTTPQELPRCSPEAAALGTCHDSGSPSRHHLVTIAVSLCIPIAIAIALAIINLLNPQPKVDALEDSRRRTEAERARIEAEIKLLQQHTQEIRNRLHHPKPPTP